MYKTKFHFNARVHAYKYMPDLNCWHSWKEFNVQKISNSVTTMWLQFDVEWCRQCSGRALFPLVRTFIEGISKKTGSHSSMNMQRDEEDSRIQYDFKNKMILLCDQWML